MSRDRGGYESLPAVLGLDPKPLRVGVLSDEDDDVALGHAQGFLVHGLLVIVVFAHQEQGVPRRVGSGAGFVRGGGVVGGAARGRHSPHAPDSGGRRDGRLPRWNRGSRPAGPAGQTTARAALRPRVPQLLGIGEVAWNML